MLVLDFETVDPQITTLGPGWATDLIKIVGCSFRAEDDFRSYWTDSVDKIKEIVSKHDTLVAHNGQYDFGILSYLGIDIKDKTLIDTKHLAKLYDNRLQGTDYSLARLGQRYLGEKKLTDDLGMLVHKHDIYREKDKVKHLKLNTTNIKKLNKYAYTIMDVLYDLEPDKIIEYANRDVDITYKLYKYFLPKLKQVMNDIDSWVYRLSCVQKLAIQSRIQGVRVDINRAKEISLKLKERENVLLETIHTIVPETILANVDSPKDLKAALDYLGILYPMNPPTANDKKILAGLDQELALACSKSDIPLQRSITMRICTLKQGRPSITSGWLNKQTHPFCLALAEYRRINKIRRDFVDKMISMDALLPAHKRGRIYPTLNVLGAETGRFTSANPNIQQIPSRDDELAPLLKSCFLPEEGEQWVSMDYAQQEFRLFAHYCYVSGVSDDLYKVYQDSPSTDYHTIVATMIGGKELRKEAKTINLGSLYGMGKKKQQLNLEKIGMSPEKADEVYDLYHEKFPSVKLLSKECANRLKKRGYILTLGGRLCRLDKPYIDPETGEEYTFEYQGISKLIQGSASDMMLEVLTKCWERGINIMFSIHDAVELSVKNMDQVKELKDIMENCFDITIPMPAKTEIGPTWGDVKEIDL